MTCVVESRLTERDAVELARVCGIVEAAADSFEAGSSATTWPALLREQTPFLRDLVQRAWVQAGAS